MGEGELTALLGSLGLRNITRRGGNIMFSCPNTLAHPRGDQRPSCGMKVEAPHPWGCFACEIRGKTLYSFLIDQGGMSVRQARLVAGQEEQFAKDLTIEIAKPERIGYEEERLYPFYASKRSDLYLKLRGLSLETIRELGLAFDRIENRVVFPWFIDGKLVAITGRTLNPAEATAGAKNKHYIAGADKRNLLYLPQRRIDAVPLILVEGEFDAAKVYEAGLHNVAALGHAKFSDGQTDLTLKSAATEVWIFTDDDPTGEQAASIIEAKLKGKRMTRRIRYDSVRRNYKHLLSRRKKLDPGVLDVEDLRIVLTASADQLFPNWSTVNACRMFGNTSKV